MADYITRKAGGITSHASTDPNFFLYGGESDIVTDRAEVAVELTLAQFTVVVFDASGRLIAYTGTGTATGILAESVDTTAATGTGVVTSAPFFTGGQFNHEALIWPAATDTLAERRAAFAGTNIGVHRLP